MIGNALIEICMDNREADIARFVRRHLSDENLSRIRGVLRIDPNTQSDDDEGRGAVPSQFPGSDRAWMKL